jgi:hypothetical protein
MFSCHQIVNPATAGKSLLLASSSIPKKHQGRQRASRQRILASVNPSSSSEYAREIKDDHVASRRKAFMLVGSVLGGTWTWTCADANASSGGNPDVVRGLGKYVKKKKLDKIDTYLPPLFLARDQLVRVERVSLQSPADARQQLRSGAFSGLRDTVRSVGEYISREKNDEALGKRLVAGFFKELEAIDFALLSATRSETLDVPGIRSHVDGCVKAIDALVAQLPEDIVSKAQGVAKAVSEAEEQDFSTDVDPDMKLLM